jgi:hypothetical protein
VNLQEPVIKLSILNKKFSSNCENSNYFNFYREMIHVLTIYFKMHWSNKFYQKFFGKTNKIYTNVLKLKIIQFKGKRYNLRDFTDVHLINFFVRQNLFYRVTSKLFYIFRRKILLLPYIYTGKALPRDRFSRFCNFQKL